ncbi:potassium channel family protein [Halobacillus campisalis]|uniref:Potassium channel family protein n=1 Tax=Halobacillus campisalis TaxID=435909 RepID=A0ABW2JZQ2_9BACI|nr:potassium channel family protein [Halobacillus campisalis]
MPNFSKRPKLAVFYETFLILLALASVLFIWTDHPVLQFIDRFIWIIFLLDVLIRIAKADHKLHYIKHNPFDFIAAIPLDSTFQLARIARLIKIIKFLPFSKRYLRSAFSILHTNGLDRVLTVSFLLIFGSAIVVKMVEPRIDTFSDGVWWSIVTTTTVGYGDISPETSLGRLIAVILMLVGIGLIGMLTGSITTFFVKENKSSHPAVTFIKGQLNRYEDLSWQELQQISVLIEEMKEEKKEK